MNTKEWKEELSNPETGRKLMSDYGNMAVFIEALLKKAIDRAYEAGAEWGDKYEYGEKFYEEESERDFERLYIEFNITNKEEEK